MGVFERRFTPTGVDIIWTPEGTKIVAAEVRREANVHMDTIVSRNQYKGQYMPIGTVRLLPKQNIYAAAPKPHLIERLCKIPRTKTFHLMLDLMRLAQWEPIHKFGGMCSLGVETKTKKFGELDITCSETHDVVDWTQEPALIDESLYRHFDFTPAMIDWTEAHYHDDLRTN